MSKVLIVYASRSGETQNIADLIAEGVRFAGHEAEVVNVKEIKSEGDLDGFDGYAFGSATYHGEMLQGMKTFLFLAEKADLEGKVGGAFGSYGWSGEAIKLINASLEEMKFRIVDPGIKVQYVPTHEDLHECVELGKKVATALREEA